MIRLIKSMVLMGIIVSTALCHSTTYACTGITIKPKDGSVIFGRTLEFAQELHSNIIVVPRNLNFMGTAPGQKQGLTWTTQYGFVGMNAFGLPIIADGVNEKGLHVGIFYFPGYADFQTVTEKDLTRTISPQQVPVYLLSNCITVDDVVEKIKQVKVGKVVLEQLGGIPPFHYIATDASGKSIVLEYVKGELNIHQNPLGVFTNAPAFDWHLTNLGNYVNLTDTNKPDVMVGDLKINGFGKVAGLFGIPGDFTPPSRFVRATAFSATALPVQTALEGVLQTFHILNQFDIPKGAVRGSMNGKSSVDYTLWTAVTDLTNLRYYFRTYEDSTIRMINLNCVDLNATEIKTISIQGEEQIMDVSGCAR